MAYLRWLLILTLVGCGGSTRGEGAGAAGNSGQGGQAGSGGSNAGQAGAAGGCHVLPQDCTPIQNCEGNWETSCLAKNCPATLSAAVDYFGTLKDASYRACSEGTELRGLVSGYDGLVCFYGCNAELVGSKVLSDHWEPIQAGNTAPGSCSAPFAVPGGPYPASCIF